MTESQFEGFIARHEQFVWRRALLLSRGDEAVAEKHAVQMFVSIWNQMINGTYKSVTLSVMEYIREELAARD